ncbi:retrovirus-related pol polyprotein from transposon TNT 1-94 [Tanacetum coccineum]
MYFLVVADDYSRFTWIFFLATKDETSCIFKSFITGIENLVDHKVKVIRCDNGTEFKNREVNQFCEMKGILRQFSVARTPQQNGVTKRRNRTLIEAARTMLADSKLPTTFWAEVVNTACYVQNRVLVVKPHNKTPYELFHGKTPTLSFMRPFGYPVTILNTIDHLGKFDGKANECFFVGYSLNSNAFRVFNSRTRIVEENLHIRFSENTPNVVGCGPNWLFDIDALTKIMNYEPIVADQEKKDNVNITNNVNDASTNEVNDVGGKTSIELSFDQNMTALEDYSTFDFLNNDEDDGAEADMNNLDTIIQVSPIPTTRIHKDHPLNQEEPKKVIHALKDPSWIEAMQEELLQFKLQEVWTLVDLPKGKRAIGSKWVFRNKKDERGIVIKNKARMVAQGGFQRGKIDKTLFIKRHKGDIVLVQVYVDDIIFVKQKKDGIFISQDIYVAKDLKKFGFTEVKTASTPMETQKPLLKDEDGEEVDVHMYRLMIGSLMYLTSSRPDIMFAVCACARYQVNPKVSHLHAVKRIFRYLKGQPKLGLWYPKDSPFDLVAYIDSDYAGASLDRKSTTGGCQFLGCRLISWQLIRQNLYIRNYKI